MLEQKINEFFGDDEPSGFGTGWWSGVLSAFFGVLAFGAVVVLHFPQLLSSPELRPHYSMQAIRMLIQGVIVAAIVYFFVVVPVNKLMERRKQGEEPEVAAPTEDILLLQEIRDLLRARGGQV